VSSRFPKGQQQSKPDDGKCTHIVSSSAGFLFPNISASVSCTSFGICIDLSQTLNQTNFVNCSYLIQNNLTIFALELATDTGRIITPLFVIGATMTVAI
jgi:hypothetical protein